MSNPEESVKASPDGVVDVNVSACSSASGAETDGSSAEVVAEASAVGADEGASSATASAAVEEAGVDASSSSSAEPAGEMTEGAAEASAGGEQVASGISEGSSTGAYAGGVVWGPEPEPSEGRNNAPASSGGDDSEAYGPQRRGYHQGPAQNDGRKTFKLFIGGLAPETSTSTLADYFEQFGHVVEAEVLLDKFSKESRGFAFVHYEDDETAKKVVAMTEHILDGRPIDVRNAVPKAQPKYDENRRVFVGGIEESVTEDQFRDYFAQYGPIEGANIMFDKDTNRHRGFGFIVYETLDDAHKSIGLHPQLGGNCECKKAQPRPSRSAPDRDARRGGRSGAYSPEGRRGGARYGGREGWEGHGAGAAWADPSAMTAFAGYGGQPQDLATAAAYGYNPQYANAFYNQYYNNYAAYYAQMSPFYGGGWYGGAVPGAYSGAAGGVPAMDAGGVDAAAAAAAAGGVPSAAGMGGLENYGPDRRSGASARSVPY
eukprot:GHVT01062307.1.p1 GENE.GHVT01062307.1~~GHVT01062307.1.p1  ORF type:complete len:487 (-),score=115.37 GHVT01062307.1:814-2274(-)